MTASAGVPGILSPSAMSDFWVFFGVCRVVIFLILLRNGSYILWRDPIVRPQYHARRLKNRLWKRKFHNAGRGANITLVRSMICNQMAGSTVDKDRGNDNSILRSGYLLSQLYDPNHTHAKSHTPSNAYPNQIPIHTHKYNI